MFIVNGGIPRSGTVLLGEMLRALMRNRGLGIQRYNPQERRHLPAFADYIQQAPPDPAVLVHTHLIDQTCLDRLARREDAVVFWNHRDPRDALVSLIRLHNMPLEQALHSLEVYLRATDLVRACGHAHGVRYERLVTDVPGHLRRAAAVLGWQPDAAEVETIVEATSPQAHAQVMRDVQNGERPALQIVQTLFREMREDGETLINDRHIQSGQAGRWKTEMDPKAQALATDRLRPWIEAYGYQL